MAHANQIIREDIKRVKIYRIGNKTRAVCLCMPCLGGRYNATPSIEHGVLPSQGEGMRCVDCDAINMARLIDLDLD